MEKTCCKGSVYILLTVGGMLMHNSYAQNFSGDFDLLHSKLDLPVPEAVASTSILGKNLLH